ncbi:unnamed protein product [Caenorhabditis sp. 36 PRJEB53466]|nr:unnamed protein product [Caenorhabditis sp. 36 PRJEB53466]
MRFGCVLLFVTLLGITAHAVDLELKFVPEDQLTELDDSNNFPTALNQQNSAELEVDNRNDNVEVGKRLYILRDGYNNAVKRSLLEDMLSMGQTESLEDGHGMEKRMYITHTGFRPDKRSMAIGRAGMRPGKRAFAMTTTRREKKGQLLPESYLPIDRFIFLE